MKSSSKKNVISIALATGLALVAALIFSTTVPAIGAMMSSPSYSIQSDSVNLGGLQSNSASYKVEDTVGEVGTGDSNSTNYKIRAGYQQMNGSYIAMTAASDIVMSPSLSGITGGTSNGSTVTTVTTDSAAGYELYIKASLNPAMQGNAHGDTIDNYAPGGTPDFTFTVAAPDARFGFSPEGADVVQKYLDNGSVCNTGSSNAADSCWNGVTTSNEKIAQRITGNHPSGTATTIKFRLTIGSSAIKVADDYTATTTLTAIAL